VPPSGIFGAGDGVALGAGDGSPTGEGVGVGAGVVAWHPTTTTASATPSQRGLTE